LKSSKGQHRGSATHPRRLAGGIAVLLVIILLVVAADAEMQRTQALPIAPVPPLTNKQRLK
jgi:hypothetical protein